MKSLCIWILALGFVLGTSVPAIACHVAGVDMAADSDGWRVCVTLRWTGLVSEEELLFTVELIGGDGETLETFVVQETVYRHECDDRLQVFEFTDLWVGYHTNAPFEMIVEVDCFGRFSKPVTFDIDSPVAADAASWGAVKSLYR